MRVSTAHAGGFMVLLLVSGSAGVFGGCTGSVGETADDDTAVSARPVDAGQAGKKDGASTQPSSSGGDDDTVDDAADPSPGHDAGGADAGKPAVGSDSGAPGNSSASGSLAKGITVTDLAIFQGSKVPIVTAGAPATPKYVPVVAGRPGLVRAYVTGQGATPLTGELTLTSSAGSTVVTDPDKRLTGASTDGALASTLNFDIPAGLLAPDTTFAVRILDRTSPVVTGSASNGARYPRDGSKAALGARNDGAKVTITLVPVRYNSDSSGRLPDTGSAQQALYSNFVYQTYPVASLDLQVHAPVDYAASISPTDSTSWSSVLTFILQLRKSDNAAPNNFYYGLFQPAAPDARGGATNFCRGGCILGIAPLTTRAADTTQRGGVGAGYTGLTFATTMAQEIGHACGILHAPYPAAGSTNAPQSPDPSYPYSGAFIGQWGYGFLDKVLYDPAQYRDFMSYAQTKIWVSDYVEGLFFNRFASVNQVAFSTVGEVTYDTLYLPASGDATWGKPAVYDTEPLGEPHTVEYLDANGEVVARAEGEYFGLDVGGGYLLSPQPGVRYAGARVLGFDRAYAVGR